MGFEPIRTQDPPMEYRFLGRSGLLVSAISLGGWVTFGGQVANEATFDCMKAAYDAGINFFDTAEGYAGGESEKVMGQAIKKFGWKRNDIVISTKIYWGNKFSAMKNPINNHGLSRKHIIEGVDQSLARLDLSYVDIIYAHRPDRYTPMEETVRAFNHVINTGKAFYWGTSEWSAAEIAEACGIAEKLGLIAPIVEQPNYSLLVRERVESEYTPLYERFGTGITSFSPLAAGWLTGKYNEIDPDKGSAGVPEDSRFATALKDPWVQSVRKELDKGKDGQYYKSLQVARALEPIAKELGMTQGQLALAWCLKNKNVSSVITGASKPQQLVDNVKAISLVDKLTPEVMEKIEKAVGNKPAAWSMRA